MPSAFTQALHPRLSRLPLTLSTNPFVTTPKGSKSPAPRRKADPDGMAGLREDISRMNLVQRGEYVPPLPEKQSKDVHRGRDVSAPLCLC